MNKIAIAILTVLFFSSCRDEVDLSKKPKNLIPEDSMVLILKDLTLIESHIQMKYLQVNIYKETMKKSGDVIMKKYNVDLERFESSMDYYGMRQVKLQELYSRVLDSLNLMAGKLEANGLDKQQNKVVDTIPKIPTLLRPKVKPNK
jgi:hypothetical protein